MRLKRRCSVGLTARPAHLLRSSWGGLQPYIQEFGRCTSLLHGNLLFNCQLVPVHTLAFVCPKAWLSIADSTHVRR